MDIDRIVEDEYERGVAEAQAFIDRHPHGFPGMTMAQYGAAISSDEVEAAYQRGWYDRMGEEVGTEEDPTERWRDKMEAFGCWPAGYEASEV
jgi:hypothetical protein